MANRNPDTTSTRRILALTDGVYAIAMTILILGFDAPRIPVESGAFAGALVRMSPRFLDFAISFFLLAFFWIVHHRQFEHIDRADGTLMWINIIGLMFVVTIPFSTTVYAAFRPLTAAALLFEGNMLALGLVQYLLWTYVTAGHRLVDKDLSRRHIAATRLAILTVPIASLLAMIVAFVSPGNSTLIYVLLPLVWLVMRIRR